MAHIASLYNRFIVELGEATGLPVCDLDSQVEPSLTYFYDEMHFNLEGSGRAGMVLRNCLRDMLLTPGAGILVEVGPESLDGRGENRGQ